MKSGSDYFYILMDLRITRERELLLSRSLIKEWPKWSLGKLDRDTLLALVTTGLWLEDGVDNVDACIDKTIGVITSACDASMPQSRPGERQARHTGRLRK